MNKAENVLDFYYKMCKLKETERSGWVDWNISRPGPVERIAEHIYGTQILAMAIYLEYDLDLNIDKVTTMLAHHETEEIEIGDITPFDGVTEEEKRAIGSNAVTNITSKIKNGEYIKRYVDEFEKRETKEAMFAYLIDKLECILWAKKYSDTGRISLETAPNEQIELVKEIIAKGANDAGDIFREFHRHKFADDKTFMEIINTLEKYIIKEK